MLGFWYVRVLTSLARARNFFLQMAQDNNKRKAEDNEEEVVKKARVMAVQMVKVVMAYNEADAKDRLKMVMGNVETLEIIKNLTDCGVLDEN